MNKKIIFIVMLLSAVALGAIDFAVNDYTDRLQLKADVQSLVGMNNLYIKKIEANVAVELDQTTTAKTIFNKINLEQIDGIDASTELLFTKNGVNFFKLYTFKFQSLQNQINYLKIKTLFAELQKREPSIEVNEVNPYGINSFYLNDTNEENIARIVILTSDSVFGIEYSKTVDKESIEPLLSILTQ